MSLDVDTLPKNREHIACEPIRHGAEALDAAHAAAEQARRSVVELEQTRDQALWADAAEVEQARADGKPEPKQRRHIAKHDKLTEDAKHEQKVAQLAVERADKALREAVAEHGPRWAAEAAQAAQDARGQWESAIAELRAAYGRLSTALSIVRRTSGAAPNADVVAFEPRQVRGLEIMGGQGKARGVISTADVLAALASIGDDLAA